MNWDGVQPVASSCPSSSPRSSSAKRKRAGVLHQRFPTKLARLGSGGEQRFPLSFHQNLILSTPEKSRKRNRNEEEGTAVEVPLHKKRKSLHSKRTISTIKKKNGNSPTLVLPSKVIELLCPNPNLVESDPAKLEDCKRGGDDPFPQLNRITQTTTSHVQFHPPPPSERSFPSLEASFPHVAILNNPNSLLGGFFTLSSPIIPDGKSCLTGVFGSLSGFFPTKPFPPLCICAGLSGSGHSRVLANTLSRFLPPPKPPPVAVNYQAEGMKVSAQSGKREEQHLSASPSRIWVSSFDSTRIVSVTPYLNRNTAERRRFTEESKPGFQCSGFTHTRFPENQGKTSQLSKILGPTSTLRRGDTCLLTNHHSRPLPLCFQLLIGTRTSLPTPGAPECISLPTQLLSRKIVNQASGELPPPTKHTSQQGKNSPFSSTPKTLILTSTEDNKFLQISSLKDFDCQVSSEILKEKTATSQFRNGINGLAPCASHSSLESVDKRGAAFSGVADSLVEPPKACSQCRPLSSSSVRSEEKDAKYSPTITQLGILKRGCGELPTACLSPQPVEASPTNLATEMPTKAGSFFPSKRRHDRKPFADLLNETGEFIRWACLLRTGVMGNGDLFFPKNCPMKQVGGCGLKPIVLGLKADTWNIKTGGKLVWTDYFEESKWQKRKTRAVLKSTCSTIPLRTAPGVLCCTGTMPLYREFERVRFRTWICRSTGQRDLDSSHGWGDGLLETTMLNPRAKKKVVVRNFILTTDKTMKKISGVHYVRTATESDMFDNFYPRGSGRTVDALNCSVAKGITKCVDGNEPFVGILYTSQSWLSRIFLRDAPVMSDLCISSKLRFRGKILSMSLVKERVKKIKSTLLTADPSGAGFHPGSWFGLTSGDGLKIEGVPILWWVTQGLRVEFRREASEYQRVALPMDCGKDSAEGGRLHLVVLWISYDTWLSAKISMELFKRAWTEKSDYLGGYTHATALSNFHSNWDPDSPLALEHSLVESVYEQLKQFTGKFEQCCWSTGLWSRCDKWLVKTEEDSSFNNSAWMVAPVLEGKLATKEGSPQFCTKELETTSLTAQCRIVPGKLFFPVQIVSALEKGEEDKKAEWRRSYRNEMYREVKLHNYAGMESMDYLYTNWEEESFMRSYSKTLFRQRYSSFLKKQQTVQNTYKDKEILSPTVDLFVTSRSFTKDGRSWLHSILESKGIGREMQSWSKVKNKNGREDVVFEEQREPAKDEQYQLYSPGPVKGQARVKV